MTVDAEFPADLRAALEEIGEQMARQSLAAQTAEVAYHVASDIDSGRLMDPVPTRFQHEVALAVRQGLGEHEAREAVSSGFREVFGEEATS
jgi:hypothetical protein